MKKALSLILAVMMLLGCMSVTAFAEETDNTTDITLTVAKALTYDMVIPEDVTNLSNFGIYSVGQAKVENVENATEKTVISYTAETTAFKCEGKTDIPASYYTDAQGAAAFPTTAVEVYKSKADASSIPTMYVGISETDWDAAENGTYTATVTYNFTAEEKNTAVTIASLLDTVANGFPAFDGGARAPGNAWTNANYAKTMYTYDLNSTKYLCIWDKPFVPTATELTKTSDKVYTYVSDDITLTFNLDDNGVLQNIVLSGADEGNGTYTAPTVD